MSQYCLLLGIVPLCCCHLGKLNRLSLKWMLTGISIGMVVAPVSLGLAQWIHVAGVGKMIGAVGVLLNIIHGPIGYLMATFAGIIEPGVVLTSPELFMVNVLSGLFWCSLYGSLGYNIDLRQSKEERVRGWSLAPSRKSL
ncbi:hypothetical protein [Thiovibrio frasassiensis]|uniref:Uncharacterized protein n=1 Tax=Thiovibrio frasassiensis TaxID=2984131 RepID=A0A9X4MF28_9BACT|nr:hypothetical protein [Thiovibrio frasassiensis]MDG4474975.1 hypothetical protein [Thiovibrio frasassiensis]